MAQSATARAGGQDSSASSADRQAPIETGRESTQTNRAGTTSPRPGTGRGGTNLAQPNRSPMSGPIRAAYGTPFYVMQRLSEDMDNLFEQFGFGRSGLGLGSSLGSMLSDQWDRPLTGGAGTTQAAFSPKIETFRRGDKLIMRADLPGVKKEDVHVHMENDTLTISGERRDSREEERDGTYRSECSYGSFFRAIPLPEGINADQCDAKFTDGVLEVTLGAPKLDDRSSKRIPIR